MGNTKEINKSEYMLSYEEVVEIDCVAVATAALLAADPNNEMNAMQAWNFYNGQLQACEKSKNEIINMNYVKYQ
jgi:hypothetical protein